MYARVYAYFCPAYCPAFLYLLFNARGALRPRPIRSQPAIDWTRLHITRSALVNLTEAVTVIVPVVLIITYRPAKIRPLLPYESLSG